MKEVLVPDIGDFKDVAVIEVLVKPGDAVAKEQSLITLESDKATMEIPSPSDGVVREIKIKMGDKVSKGSPILMLESSVQEKPKTESAAPPAAPVSKGDFDCDEGVAVCPRHGANIDIRSGGALTLPAVEPVATYPVRVVDGMVKVQVA